MVEQSRSVRNGLRLMEGWPVVAILLALGALERFAWAAIRSTSGASGEAMRVAMSVGADRGFADAYGAGHGLTAHLLPISPGIAGMVYAALGPGSRAAEAVLACWSIALALGTYLIAFRAFGRLGTPRWARLVALAAACTLPTYVAQEAVDFRVWEGGLTAFLSVLVLDRTLAHRDPNRATSGALAITALIVGVLFFTNPPAGVSAGTVVALFSLTHLSWPRTMLVAGIGVATTALLVTPWALRNQRAVGAPVLLRSNAGLELAVANYPGVLHAKDREAEFMRRLGEIHPAVGAGAFRAMKQAGGEVAYSRHLGNEAKAWMRAHPGEAAQLLLLHVRQTIAPQPWQFSAFGTGGGVALRAALASVAGLAGVIGLALALIRRRPGWAYPAVLIAVLIMLSSPFQPAKRYTYLVYPVLVFAAADLLARAVALTAGRRRAADQAA